MELAEGEGAGGQICTPATNTLSPEQDTHLLSGVKAEKSRAEPDLSEKHAINRAFLRLLIGDYADKAGGDGP